MTATATRYALYIAPAADSPLWRFGCAVLGYDAQCGCTVPQLVPDSVPAQRFRELTEDPRRYGFHATIRPPMRLADGCDEAALVAAVERFCETRTPFALPELSVDPVGTNGDGSSFVALVEPRATPELLAFERAVVTHFEPFRAPLTPEEFARRRPERLTERQRANLHRWGYPGVLDEFRFHLTLTGRVPAPELPGILAGLRAHYARIAGRPALAVDHLAIFRQQPGERFTILHRVPLRRINENGS